MPYIRYNLPEYPCKRDLWDLLSEEKRPIVVYGMGNGADKLFSHFEKYGISVSDVFASDGFVRGHVYRGYRVKSFSEIKATYSDFVIVLSFASSREEVLSMLGEIDSQYEMYAPDMPVAGEDEYFDRAFYNENYGKILSVYESLADEESRAIYASVLNYRLTGKISYLLSSYTPLSDMYSIYPVEKIRTAADAGAYNGDTAREAEQYFPTLEKIYAIEPDPRNYKKLLKYSEKSKVEIIPINSAVWSECAEGEFISSGNRNSSVASTASHEHKVTAASLISIDSLDVSFDYIKYDVEGAEREALLGSKQTITEHTPTLLVSLYHRSRDIFELPLLVNSIKSGYRAYIRRLNCIPAWELNLILVPENQ